MALGKLKGEASRTEANGQPKAVAVEEVFDAKRAHVEHLERDIAAEAEKREQLFAKRGSMCETARRQLAEDGTSLHKI